jgi:hypothetical protein
LGKTKVNQNNILRTIPGSGSRVMVHIIWSAKMICSAFPSNIEYVSQWSKQRISNQCRHTQVEDLFEHCEKLNRSVDQLVRIMCSIRVERKAELMKAEHYSVDQDG